MRNVFRTFCFAAVGMLAIACGGDGDTSGQDVLEPDDMGAVDRGEFVAVLPDKGSPFELPVEVPLVEVLDIVYPKDLPEVPEGVQETEAGGEDVGFEEEVTLDCPGGAYCPCEVNEDCDSELCIETMTGWQCMNPCLSAESCPKSWQCAVVAGTGGDVVYGCVDPNVHLCQPCKTNDECASSFLPGKNLCIEYGPHGLFCGSECDDEEDCPAGFACTEEGDGRQFAMQCRPVDDGECPCSEKHIDKAYLTFCYEENEFGKCVGERTCDVECGAQVPSGETCNGLDEDCDGATDEDVPSEPCDLENLYGICPGLTLCISGNPVCDGVYATPEDCNGFDDDCDGDTDEFFPDTDLDGIADCIDDDIDGDDFLNENDNCPWEYNPGQEDCDNDGIGDACDGDDDDDFIPNVWDNCRCLPNPGQEDMDADTIGDLCDCDIDGDGVPNANPECPEPIPSDNCPLVDNPLQEDMDQDGEGDVCDCDIDGDGLGNVNPGCPEPSPKDNCPGTANPDQLDTNGNGVGDACEDDVDGDGIKDEVDNCVFVSNPLQEDMNQDGEGDACDCDMDGDGVFNFNPDCDDPDPADNCPKVVNPLQADLDGDDVGDLCDPDMDGDQDPNELDCAPMDGAVYHGQYESCNEIDDNCDGQVDEEDALDCDALFYDFDGDDFGVSENVKCLCAPKALYTAPAGGDCSDYDETVNPGVDEVCNAKDDDCDGQVNEEGATGCQVYFRDVDNDGFGMTGESKCLCAPDDPYVTKLDGDCNDYDGFAFPGATETCNGKDDNCNGETDELNAVGCSTYFMDADGDGYGIPGDSQCHCSAHPPYSAKQIGEWDCDDTDGAVHPKGLEVCNDKDDDCDGVTDEDEAEGCTVYYLDGDHDGYGVALSFKCTCSPKLPYDTVKTGDCNDNDATMNPGATEECNQKDDECDGAVDEEDALGCVDYFRDGDGDSWGTDEKKCLCVPFGKFTADLSGDCNDVDKNVYPGSSEVCNGKDDDCNGVVDDEDASQCTERFYDGDMDGYGVSGQTKCQCKGTDGYTASVGGDCADDDPDVHPGSFESCNGKDDDCDNLTDEEQSFGCLAYYFDWDWDTWGTPDSKCLCAPEGLFSTLTPGDCNDTTALINPAMEEVCNTADDDCDGFVDETDVDNPNPEGCSTFYYDGDGDGYGTADFQCLCVKQGYYRAQLPDDCDDTASSVHPEADEVCQNGKDDDCDGETDEEDCQGCITYYLDVDNDGYGLSNDTQCLSGPLGNYRATLGDDCDDTLPEINPGAFEACNDVDDDCDYEIDEENATGCGPIYYDGDADDWGTVEFKCLCKDTGLYRADQSGDCNDTDAFVFPGTTEKCNSVDDDCNGATDEAGATGCTVFNHDFDGDGWGTSETQCLCSAESPFTANKSGDCNDGDKDVNPDTPEECNGKDDDCDNITDEANAQWCATFYLDVDGDTYGVTNDTKCLCAGSGQYAASEGGDCNDGDPLVFPGATESCNGKDDDCNAATDEEGAFGCSQFYFDGDDDEWGTATVQSKCLCNGSPPYSAAKVGDCNDSSQGVNPDADEACNWIDDDCDGATDEEASEGCSTFFLDGDGDGYGLDDQTKCLCGPSGNYSAPVGGDCTDVDGAIYPDAPEICNGKDDDCDGATDEEGATGCTTYYFDTDGDGWGTTDSLCLCAMSGPYKALSSGDCNDGNPNVNPTALETCNGLDDDCDSVVDEVNANGCLKFYRDVDGDGFGTSQFQCLCVAEVPFTALVEGDCNDSVFLVNPDMEETCNAQDDDCDGLTDEEDSLACETFFYDNDGDGFGATGNTKCLCVASGKYTAGVGGDCNDLDDDTFPGATERCSGKDDNCDGTVDEENAFGCLTKYNDADGDTYGLTGDTRCLCGETGTYTADQGGDCNDTDALVFPGALETCNGKDDNCDTVTDPENTHGCTNWQLDMDQDGWGTLQSKCLCASESPYNATGTGDCNDNNADVNPAAPELCNGVDDDCDTQVDEEDGQGCLTHYYDNDGDGYGVETNPKCLCNPSGKNTALTDGDCNDNDYTVFPGQVETCNGKDDDCDGLADGEGSGGCFTKYMDADADTFGVNADFRCLCAGAGTYTADIGGDCNDGDNAVNPLAQELCGNLMDDDCNGETDEAGCQGCISYYLDVDGDTWGVTGDTQCLSAPQGSYTATRGQDCKDDDAAVNPGGTEACNGKDDDCDGVTDGEGSTGCDTFHYDYDVDGFGVVGNSKCLCASSDKYTAVVTGDCNDIDNTINPDGVEKCNGKDDDCNGDEDEEGAQGCFEKFFDNDQDGFGLDGDTLCLCMAAGKYTADVGSDCNDNDGNVNPAAVELCDNGKDDDCNGETDEEGCQGCVTFYLDVDDDTWGVTGDTKCLNTADGDYRATRGGDCDDGDLGINPAALESCNDKDDDCNGVTDGQNSDGCNPYYYDFDVDTYGVTGNIKCLCAGTGKYTGGVGGDCNDNDPNIFPGQDEECNNKDDDCDGNTDEEDSDGCLVFYFDNDTDGFGMTGNAKCLCSASGKWTTGVGGDCDDGDAAVNPSALELCNGKDDDCNGVPDPEDSQGCTLYYYDFDSDTWGTTHSKCLCSQGGYYTTTTSGDCNDNHDQVYPDAPESCNNIDDDCDGVTDETGSNGCTTFFKDEDDDNYGETGNTQCICLPEGHYTATQGGDCDDTNAGVNPSRVEECNGLDDDCNSQTDEADDMDMCGTVQNGEPLCSGGDCMAVCDSGFFDVNQMLTDGCECQQDGNDHTGNQCSGAINLGTLSDATPGSVKTASGRIVPGTDEDWYEFSATDSTDTGTFSSPGHDRYHVRVRVTSPADGSIRANVYKGTCNDAVACTSGSHNARDTQWYTNFSNTTTKTGHDPCVSAPSWDCCKTGECGGGQSANACCGGINNDNPTQCTDSLKNKRQCGSDASTFFVKVYRASGAATSCAETEYAIEISNGKFPAP